jgi:6-phosphogluconolactonase/glucosamine-6-phosphate isomerase/deaminase
MDSHREMRFRRSTRARWMIAPTASPLRARREEGARAFDRSRGKRGTQRLSSTLEAIFLATFVLISQRGQRKTRAPCGHRVASGPGGGASDSSEQILQLTQAIHEVTVAHTTASASS